MAHHRSGRLPFVLAIAFVVSVSTLGATDPPPSDLVVRVTSGLEAASALSKGLSDWALLTLAGTLLLVFSTSYRRLKNGWRYLYVLFPAAWTALGISLWSGLKLQQHATAFHFVRQTDQNASDILEKANVAVSAQIASFESALVLLGVWLIAYVIGLVFVGPDHIEA
jgi:hypothetical protein